MWKNYDLKNLIAKMATITTVDTNGASTPTLSLPNLLVLDIFWYNSVSLNFFEALITKLVSDFTNSGWMIRDDCHVAMKYKWNY